MNLNDIIVYWTYRVALVDFKTWVALSFIPIPILFIWALWRADQGNQSTFKFVHFVTADTGRGSPFALGYTTLVMVCAWGVWALIVLEKLSEWYMTLVIGGFVIGALGSRATQVVARVKGAAEPPPTAGDADEPEIPMMKQETKTTTTVVVPAVTEKPTGKG